MGHRRVARHEQAPPVADISAPVDVPPWSGDPAAFALVFEENGAAVHALASRVGGPALAADITQDVFVRLWKDPGRFDPSRGSLRTFLLTLAHHATVDRLRADSARRARELRVHARDERPLIAADAPALSAETEARVAMALGRLPARTRTAIVTAYWGGLTYREVAEASGEPEGTVKSRIRSGLQQLRGELGDLRSDLC